MAGAPNLIFVGVAAAVIALALGYWLWVRRRRQVRTTRSTLAPQNHTDLVGEEVGPMESMPGGPGETIHSTARADCPLDRSARRAGIPGRGHPPSLIGGIPTLGGFHSSKLAIESFTFHFRVEKGGL